MRLRRAIARWRGTLRIVANLRRRHATNEVEGEGVGGRVNVRVRVGVMVPVPAWVLLTSAGVVLSWC